MNTLLFPKMGAARNLVAILFFTLTPSILFGSSYPNGGFEESTPSRDLGAGVDKTGFATIPTATGTVPSADGGFSNENLAFSVSVADMNADGLPDIAAMDGFGVLRIYFNSGSKTEPKFTFAETTSYSLYPAPIPTRYTIPQDPDFQAYMNAIYLKTGQRISLFNNGNLGGKSNLLVTTAQGRMFYFPNTGTENKPDFKAPDKIEETPIQTGSFPFLAQALSPFVVDWNNDRKIDIIFGEGSYSANSIHLFLNQGSAAAPTFNEEKRMALALGEGREQLTPALADINGDGTADLLVTDRRGRLTAYVRPANWKWSDSIKPTGFVAKTGGLTPDENQALVLGSGIHTIATGDLNGDGLFDLVAGKSNGRLAWAANKGGKDNPKFEALTDLAGDKPSPAAWQLPSQWDVDTGKSRGNFLAYANCVSAQEDPAAQPAEGTRALRFGYAATPNKTVPAPSLLLGASRAFDRRGEQENSNPLFRASAEQRGTGAPSNFFVLRQPLQMEIGKTYTLTFKAKGNKVSNGSFTLGWRGFKQLGEDRLVRGERGAVDRQRNAIYDGDQESVDFRPSASWSTVTRDFKIQFKKERDLNKEKLTSEGILEISFELTAPDGFLYLDEIKLVPAA